MSEQIKEEELLNIVTKAIRQQARVVLDMSRVEREREAAQKKISKEIHLREAKLVQDISNIKLDNIKLYERYRSGELDRDEFLLWKKKNEERWDNLAEQLKQVEDSRGESNKVILTAFLSPF
ncbi:hypothetical protein [Robinsoniella peoriensis]|uniref:hypothetical protein n=1 Tax=Robinsoniella peoriensis TaxID=180332 RepID=UPI00363A2869